MHTVKVLLNARVFIINKAVSMEGDGRLLKATMFGNVQAFILGFEIIGGPRSTPDRTFVYNCHLFRLQEKKKTCVLYGLRAKLEIYCLKYRHYHGGDSKFESLNPKRLYALLHHLHQFIPRISQRQ